MSAPLVIAVWLYLSSLAASLLSFFLKHRSLATIAVRLTLAGLVAHTTAVLQRWQAAGRAPAANMHESMILFAWAVIAIGVLLERGGRLSCLRPAVVSFGLLLLEVSRLWDGAIHPLMPALKSPWLFWHVASCMLAYGAFAVGWMAGGLYLVVAWRRKAPDAQTRLHAIDGAGYQATTLGFIMLAIGIISGSIWANLAWGSWWNWDPKETWALVTWLTYAIYLHNRLALNWRAEKLAWFSVWAFPCVLFTYVGVNYLLVGLHSYAK